MFEENASRNVVWETLPYVPLRKNKLSYPPENVKDIFHNCPKILPQ
jgi:hypothetical protein